MRHILIAIFLMLFIASPVGAAGQSSNVAQAQPDDAEALEGIDALVEKSLKDFEVPGAAVSIVKDGRVILSKGYGLRDPASRAPMTDRTIFPIASISKGFTSLAAEMLVNEGKLSLDAPVSTYLLGFRSKDPTLTLGLTLRDMLSHRSGMISYDALSYRNVELTREDLLNRLPYLDVTYPMRTRFKYNNTMFALAGLTLERVSGEPFEGLIDKRILKPLGMNDSFYGYDRAMSVADRASGVVKDGKGWKTVPLFHASPGLDPPGGIYSNARDLANWMIFQLDEGRFQDRQLVPAAAFKDMRKLHIAATEVSPDPERTPLGYGLGWFIDDLRGHRMIQHGGALTGFTTITALIPDQHLGVTILLNQDLSPVRYDLAWEILDRFLTSQPKDWVGEARARQLADSSSETNQPAKARKAAPNQPLSNYAGLYDSPAFGQLVVRVENGALRAKYFDDESALMPVGGDVFEATTRDPVNIWFGGERAQFVTDLSGKIETVRVELDPSADVRMEFTKQTSH